MATVHFTSHLQGYVACEPRAVEGDTVAAVLRTAVGHNEVLRSYLLDEQGRLRRHIAVFVDGQLLADRSGLSDPVKPDSEVYVMQALSGG